MSLAPFVPAQPRKSRPGKGRAIPLTFPAHRAAARGERVTDDRTAPVGRPATPRLGQDPVFVETAAAGLEALLVLERRGREVARDLRWRRIASARAGLAGLVDGLRAVVSLATTAARARGEDVDLAQESDGYAASEVTRRAIHELIARQATDDWTSLAEAVERALVPALAAWRAVFEAFLAPRRDPDPHGWAA